MPLATRSDVEARLGRSLTASEDARVSGLIDEASDQVIGYVPRAGTMSPVPDAVTRVVSRMVARLFEAPTGQVGVQGTQYTAGQFQMSSTYTPESRSGGPWLSASDRRALRPYRLGVVSVRTWTP